MAVWYRTDVPKIIEVAPRLQPDALKVLAISGSAPSDLAYLDELRDQLKQSTLEVEYVAGTPIDELLARVSHLSTDTIVVVISYSKDLTVNLYVPRDVVAIVASVSTAPVYALSDTQIGTGAVGGYVVSWAKTGDLTANVAPDILHGKSPADVIVPASGISSTCSTGGNSSGEASRNETSRLAVSRNSRSPVCGKNTAGASWEPSRWLSHSFS